MLKKFIYIFLILPTVIFAQINESDSLKVKADLDLNF